MKKSIFKTKIFTVTFILLSTFFVQKVYSQNFTRANDWKKFRKEVIVKLGASEFLGDLGGLDRIGTDFSPVDLEFSLTRPAVSVAYRYKIAKNLNWHSSFDYLLVAGNDKLTKEPFRNNRNLNFKSNIFEVATRVELSYFSRKAGHRYGIKKTLARRHKARSYELMGFVGIGGFYFNPKGKHPVTGQWVKLYPLHTEGQGLPNGPKQYKRVSLSIPMGVVYRLIINKQWGFGVEFNYRKTFTDYIDDVSTTYYDKTSLRDAYGQTSVTMSDPSLGNIPGATMPDGSGMAAQRGDKDRDAYMGLQVTVSRFFPPKRGKSKLRSKF